MSAGDDMKPMNIQSNGSAMAMLMQHPNLFAKQTRKGCFQEMFGCEAQTEFNIATLENPKQDVLYALEESSCCIRFFCPTIRPFEMNVSTAGDRVPVAKFERPCAIPTGACKCCCFQKMIAKDVDGRIVGDVTETCWICVPGFKVRDVSGKELYDLHQPTCCGGLCVDICKEGLCNCRIPFYVYPPGETENEVGKIVKVWSGMVNELFTDADKFEIDFPADADAETRANLLGALFLINMIFFESKKDNKNIPVA